MNTKNPLFDELEFVEVDTPQFTYVRSAFSESLCLVDDFNEMPRAVKPALHKLAQDRPEHNGYGVVTEHDLD